MGKLHEVLAAEPNLEGIAKKLLEEAKKTFSRTELFSGKLRKLQMFDEERAQEEISEFTQVDTTVDEKLQYLKGPLTQWWDVIFQKEATNQSAKADLVVGDTTLLADVPATYLLNLEKRLTEMRNLVLGLPTLAPGTKWDQSDERIGVFKASEPEVKMKTEKVMAFVTVTEATPQHKAQYEKVPNDSTVGKYVDTAYSGMISSARKSEILGRVDATIIAVKQARQRANSVEASSISVADPIWNFIFN